MLSLVIVLVFVILKAEASTEAEYGVIRLSYSYDTNGNYTVWKDKPLKIIIDNGYARYIWCVDGYVKKLKPEQFVPETEFNTDSVNILNIKQVTTEMNTRWACTVLQEYHGPATPYTYNRRNYTAKTLHFKLYVKGARQVILTANHYNLMYNITSDKSVQYYGSGNYTYVDGEDVEFTCEKKKDETHGSETLRLEYFNAEGILLFQTKSRTKLHQFRSGLKSANDKYYLDCICASTDPVREYRYRTNFYLKRDTEEHTLEVSINGQKLTPILNEMFVDHYVFKYVDGEIVNVTCEMAFFSRVTMDFIFDSENLNYRIYRSPRSPNIISVKILTSNIHKKTVTCYNKNTDAHIPNAKILFLSDVPHHDIRVRGLPRNKILYQYTNDFNQWTIEYQYSVYDTLNLTCVSNSGLQDLNQRNGLRSSPVFLWELKGAPIIVPANWSLSLPNIKFTNELTIILDKTHNLTTIKCIYYPQGTKNSYENKAVEIVLRLKPEIEANSSEVTSDSNVDIIMIVPIAVCFGVAVSIITIVCLVCWRKRTIRANLIENAYDTLSNQNDSSIPAFPSQWEANYNNSHNANIDEEVMQENYNYATDNDKLYRMPFKRESNNSENHYTEIDDYFKPRPDGHTTDWNKAQPSKYKKDINTLKGTASHNSNDAIYNNVIDSKHGTNDKLMHHNLPNKTNNNNSIQSKGKSKSVTFRQMSTDLRPERNFSDGNSRLGRNNDQRLKQNNGGHFANTDQEYLSGDMQNKSDNENNFTKNKKTVNPLDLEYAEPYGDLGISCKSGLYG